MTKQIESRSRALAETISRRESAAGVSAETRAWRDQLFGLCGSFRAGKPRFPASIVKILSKTWAVSK